MSYGHNISNDIGRFDNRDTYGVNSTFPLSKGKFLYLVLSIMSFKI